MVQLDERERILEEELERLSRRHPLYPRAWREEVERRVARTGLETEETVFMMCAERGLIPPAPVTIVSMLESERRYLALFEPDELLPEIEGTPARSSAD